MRREIALHALVALLAAGWLYGAMTASGGPGDGTTFLGYLVPWPIIAVPWMVAVHLLLRRANPSTVDTPERLLAAATLLAPSRRRDWGEAMVAELRHVAEENRWRFAVGCARAVVFPPGALREPMAVAAVLGTGITWAALHDHPLQVLAATLVGLVGVLAQVAHGRRLAPTALLGVAATSAAIGVVGYWLVAYPGAAAYLSPRLAIPLAVVLAACLWLTTTPPRALRDRKALLVGAMTAVLLGVGFVITSRYTLTHSAEGTFDYLMFVPLAATAITGLISGVRGAVWTVVLSTLTLFVVGLAESLVWYRTGGWLIFAGDHVPLHAAGENIRGFTWGLVLLPFWWFPAGVVAAWLRYRRSWTSNARLRSMPPP